MRPVKFLVFLYNINGLYYKNGTLTKCRTALTRTNKNNGNVNLQTLCMYTKY